MGFADNPIPEDQLPQCWIDDVRMNALFAPFRLKTVNPESWEMKMKFWSDMLRLWCRFKKDPIVSAADARVAFLRKGRSPACLEIVVEQCFQNGDLSPISKYHQILHNGPENWIRWGARLALKPAALALTAVSFLLPGKQTVDNDGLPKAGIDSTQRFVLESAVQEQATELIQNFPAGAERLGTVEELMKSCGWMPAQRETFEILLGWLVSQGAAVKQGDVIKLASSASTKAAPITEVDANIARLTAAARRLSEDATRLTRDADRATSDARSAAFTGDRRAAKNHLRRKHKLLERVARCEEAQDNIRQLLITMQDMEVNTAVVNTYKMSAQAMKQGMKEGGLDEDTVHNTMDDLKDVLETYGEVEKALSSTTDDIDAAELEEELQQILATPSKPGLATPPKPATPTAAKPVADNSFILNGPPLPSPPRASPLAAPRASPLAAPLVSPRRVSEREFVFDGEARVLAELDQLDVEERGGARAAELSPKSTKPWYPKEADFALDKSLDQLCQGFSELHTDQRLHPGQKLDVSYEKPSPLYNSEFQIQDHLLSDGVWLFNSKDSNHNPTELATSTEYFSSESPGKFGGTFQMAPGGERRPSSPWRPDSKNEDLDNLQERLNNLRGFHL